MVYSKILVSLLKFKNYNMKQIFNVIIIIVVGLALSYISFNHINAWLGVILVVATIGVSFKYIYKQLKTKQNEKN